MRKNKNGLKSLLKKLKQTWKIISNFKSQTKKNYKTMKTKLSKVWAVTSIFFTLLILEGCNVTRKVTTESSYYAKGDTTCTIIVKTIETYDATKKN